MKNCIDIKLDHNKPGTSFNCLRKHEYLGLALSLGKSIFGLATKFVIRLQMNFTKGYFQITFFVKNSKYLSKYHTNLFPKSRFSKYINPCLVILFCEVQNQNKQKCASRYLYQNNNKRLHFLTQISPKSFLKISVYLVKNVKSGKTFICWEPYNKLG